MKPQLRDLTLADEFRDDDVIDIDMIIGNDYYGALITGRMVKVNDMVAVESKFGWLLSGPIEQDLESHASCFLLNAVANDQLRKF